jgi:serine phosphatase RsbU (regulator of sigma subunit)
LAVFAYLAFRQHTELLVEGLRAELSATARNGAVAISPADVAAPTGDGLARLQAELGALARRNPAGKQFRVFATRGAAPVMLASSSGPGAPAVEPEPVRARIAEAMDLCIGTRRACTTRLYRYGGADWITSFAPIISDGEVIGLLAVDREVLEYRAAVRRTVGEIMLYIAACLAVAVVMGVFASLRITRPIRMLYQGALAAGEGHFTPVHVPGNDEIATLARSFNDTNVALQQKISELAALTRDLEERVAARTGELERSTVEIRRRQDALERDLVAARRIQSTIVPKSLHRERIAIDVGYVPIEAVGGDLGIVVERSSSVYDVAVGDVTGHGVSAALVGNRVHALLSTFYAANAPLDWLYHRLDYLLSREISDLGMFLTLLSCRFNLEKMTMEYAGGGHVAALHYRSSTGAMTPVESRCGIIGVGDLFCENPPVGVLAIESGDVLCLYTDGLVEAENPSGEQFGWNRLTATLSAAASRPRDGRIVSRILAAAKDFTGGLFQDDVLVLVVQII